MCSVVPARGDVATETEFFDARARRAYRAGDYETALESFQLVHEIAPSHRTLYNIALCADLAKRSDMAFSNYETYLKSGDSDDSRRTDAERRLAQLKPKLALVDITTDPPGAAIYLDRKELGQFGTTPATLALPEGEQRLVVERPDFAPREAAVVAVRGAQSSVHLVLEPWFGTVSVHVTPRNAELRLSRGGDDVRVQPERDRFRLPAGRYLVTAAATGFVPTEAQLLVRKDENARLELELVPLPAQTGRLLVSTGAVAADVFIDGRRTAVSPVTLSALSAGEHLVEVRAGGHALKRTVAIRAGRATFVELELGGSER